MSERNPDLAIAGLKIWVSGRQFPENEDYWDGNWLNVTCQCEAQGSYVETKGPDIHLSELFHFKEDLRSAYDTLNGKASLSCIEPTLSVHVLPRKYGQFELTVERTPDLLSQEHKFKFDIDQTHLKVLLGQLEVISKDYPLKGEAKLDQI